jgi:hypothetical protein
MLLLVSTAADHQQAFSETVLCMITQIQAANGSLGAVVCASWPGQCCETLVGQ